jgi:uncharacterized membrane protein
MAGIGFELRKVIGKGGLGSFLKAALSGTMIVAGPWLLSIVGITLIYNFTDLALQQNAGLFIAPVVYTYAFSLILFSGPHFLLTRIIADQIFDRRFRDAAATLIAAIIGVGVVAAGIAILSIWLLGPFPVADEPLYCAAAVVLFVTVNIIWLIMLFISILKEYSRILLAFALGLAVSVALAALLSQRLGLAGALVGFTIGHVVIAALLLYLGLRAYAPGSLRRQLPAFADYLRRYLPLVLAGALYNWGIWADKIVYWFLQGDAVAGTGFLLNDAYDLAVYFGTLSMVPGLVYFIVFSETSVYILLRKMLTALGSRTFGEIQRRKTRLLRGIRRAVVDQSIFQGVVTLSLVLAAPLLAGALTGGVVTATVFAVTLTAVFTHLLLLTLLNLQFYMEIYDGALASALTFFTVNTGLSFFLEATPGLSYLIGGAAGALVAGVVLHRGTTRLDRRILAGVG